ncbi:MAG: hypothetical protein Q9187_001883 [Circinaria calcarea]
MSESQMTDAEGAQQGLLKRRHIVGVDRAQSNKRRKQRPPVDLTNAEKKSEKRVKHNPGSDGKPGVQGLPPAAGPAVSTCGGSGRNIKDNSNGVSNSIEPVHSSRHFAKDGTRKSTKERSRKEKESQIGTSGPNDEQYTEDTQPLPIAQAPAADKGAAEKPSNQQCPNIVEASKISRTDMGDSPKAKKSRVLISEKVLLDDGEASNKQHVQQNNVDSASLALPVENEDANKIIFNSGERKKGKRKGVEEHPGLRQQTPDKQEHDTGAKCVGGSKKTTEKGKRNRKKRDEHELLGESGGVTLSYNLGLAKLYIPTQDDTATANGPDFQSPMIQRKSLVVRLKVRGLAKHTEPSGSGERMDFFEYPSDYSSPLSSLPSSPLIDPMHSSGDYPYHELILESEIGDSQLPSTPAPTAKARSKRNSKKSPYFPKSPKDKVSCIPFPALENTSFGLVQERLCNDPFRLLIATIFLNKTRGSVSMPVFYDVMTRYPTIADLASAKHGDLLEMIQHLGLQNQRAHKCIRLAQAWLDNPPQKGKRYRRLHYPKKNDGRDVKAGDGPIDDDDPRVAWEIGHLPGIGAYAIDSWRIFCRDELRGRPTGLPHELTPENIESEMQKEWTRVLPLDKELRAYLRWRWLRLGWGFNPITGDRKVIDDESYKNIQGGGIILEGDQHWSIEGLNNSKKVKVAPSIGEDNERVKEGESYEKGEMMAEEKENLAAENYVSASIETDKVADTADAPNVRVEPAAKAVLSASPRKVGMTERGALTPENVSHAEGRNDSMSEGGAI